MQCGYRGSKEENYKHIARLNILETLFTEAWAIGGRNMSEMMRSVGNFCTGCTVMAIMVVAAITALTLAWVFLI